AVVEVAEKNEKARLLMTQPGVGPITSMAFVLTMGDVKRFQRGQIGELVHENAAGRGGAKRSAVRPRISK
ncbi:MAG: transposase, partial [Candidatus Acidiferrum sp.]